MHVNNKVELVKPAEKVKFDQVPFSGEGRTSRIWLSPSPRMEL